MDQTRKPRSLVFRIVRAFGVSLSAAFASAFAGVLTFWIFGSLLTMVLEYRGIDFDEQQFFFLVMYNCLPAAMIAGLFSFFAQLRSEPRRAVHSAMRWLAYIVSAIFVMAFVAALYYAEDKAFLGDEPWWEPVTYLVATFIPCVATIAAHDILVRMVNSDGGSERGVGRSSIVLLVFLMLPLVFAVGMQFLSILQHTTEGPLQFRDVIFSIIIAVPTVCLCWLCWLVWRSSNQTSLEHAA